MLVTVGPSTANACHEFAPAAHASRPQTQAVRPLVPLFLGGEHHDRAAACGAVRFRLIGLPYEVDYCHCRSCRKHTGAPVSVTVFPGENYEAPRSWTERAYHKLIYYNKVDKGGHYAAWEQPQLFSEEVRAGFRSLRK